MSQNFLLKLRASVGISSVRPITLGPRPLQSGHFFSEYLFTYPSLCPERAEQPSHPAAAHMDHSRPVPVFSSITT